MELLKNHRSGRKYLGRDVERPLLDEIFDSAIRASNTGNMQLYCVVVTQDATSKDLLLPLHFNQKMVKDAPVVLTVCFDFNRFYKWCHINETRTDLNNLLWLLNGTIDAAILAQNIAIAAEYYELGICYLGTALYNAPEISKVLKLPRGVVPVTALTLGYPAEDNSKSDRLPVEAVIHYESYSDFSDEEIRRIYGEKEGLEQSKKFVQENQKQNLAQVYTEVRYKSADSAFFSQKIKQMLVDQGFAL